MKVEDLSAKLKQMGSTEASTLGDGLETIWWDTKTDEDAKDLAIEYLKCIQAWAKKAEEVLNGARKEL
jgi:hypothetical protein